MSTISFNNFARESLSKEAYTSRYETNVAFPKTFVGKQWFY